MAKSQRKEVTDDFTFSKIPPQSKELESAILGAILIEKNAFDAVVDILTPECFYVSANQLVFRSMISLAHKNLPIDLLTVVEELKNSNQLEGVGGPYYLSKLTNSVVSSANIEAHAYMVKEKFIGRELIRIGADVVAEAYADSSDVFEIINKVDKQWTELISSNEKRNYNGIRECVSKSMNRIEDLRQKDKHVTGTPSGFPALDRLTHGWQDTDLIVLAARPSVGKSAIALNFARNAATFYLNENKDNQAPLKSVAFFSLEMSSGQLVNRILSSESEIYLDKITNGKVDEEQLKTLYKFSEDISRLPLFIDDTPSLNIFELRAKCRRLKAKHNVGLIILDYLQLMNGDSGKASQREQEVSKISRNLKGLAKELEVPIIALSQLSRETEKRSGDKKTPQLSDLRESGAIEQDADIVMFLYRPEYYNITANEMGENNKGETDVKIAKHRNGELGTIKLKGHLAIQKFKNWEGAQPSQDDTGKWKQIKKEPQDNPLDLPF